MRFRLPLVTVKAALTLDGKIAAPQDNVGWITSEIARADVQQVRHYSDAILTGLGTVLEDDCLLTDRSGRKRARPLLRIVLDSQLRIPLTSKMVESAAGDVLVVGTSAAPEERRKKLLNAGVQVLIADGSGGRTDPRQVLQFLAEQRYQTLMVEAGAKVNWTFLDSQIADKVLFYYAPKILGGLESLPVAGGKGRQRRVDAILLDKVQVHPHFAKRVCGKGLGGQELLMFTGIVEEVGRVLAVDALPAGVRLSIECDRILSDAVVGSSIAVNGTCLTAVDLASGHFLAELSPETLARTNLGALTRLAGEPGASASLQRPPGWPLRSGACGRNCPSSFAGRAGKR